MIVVAGPPGSGKSTRFPLSSFGTDFFNADDRAAELNSGHYRRIPKEIRAQVNVEFQSWILGHINAQKSFAFETTLRSAITFDQARLAQQRGFWTAMHFVSAGTVEESIKRVMERSYRGGHSASARLILHIYERSLNNLLTALNFVESKIEVVRIYDNSKFNGSMNELMAVRRSRVTYLASDISPWLERLLEKTAFNVQRLKG